MNAAAALGDAGRVADVVLIDGRSGSGKTVLADRLLARFEAAGAPRQALRVEDLYPGWDGLAEGSLALAAALDRGEYRRYDWHAEAFGEPVRLDPRLPLIIEGCGAVTRANLDAAGRFARVLAALTGSPGDVEALWLELPEAERRERALARDGEIYAPHWDRWAAQEDRHYGLHRPWELADARFSAGPTRGGTGG